MFRFPDLIRVARIAWPALSVTNSNLIDGERFITRQHIVDLTPIYASGGARFPAPGDGIDVTGFDVTWFRALGWTLIVGWSAPPAAPVAGHSTIFDGNHAHDDR